MTQVVNIHNNDSYDVYIGRAGHGLSGEFGNPIDDSKLDRDTKCDRFAVYFRQRLKDDPKFAQRIESLRGKRLACFCIPARCHGMEIVRYLEGLTDEQQRENYAALKLSEIKCRTPEIKKSIPEQEDMFGDTCPTHKKSVTA